MEKKETEKFLLPSPNFDKPNNVSQYKKPHFLTPSGMTLLPREKQPPPMYGPRGATVPPKYLNKCEQPKLVRQYCEPCDMELHSVEEKRRHCAQHEPCPVEDCEFRGHASVMDRHVITLHSSGMFDKVKRLTTPEEIAAWRNERRKKFPTLANVLLKQAAKEERMRRGERLETNKNRFGRREDRKRPNDMQITKETCKEQADNKKPTNKQNKKRRTRKRKNSNSNCSRPKFESLEKTMEEDEGVGIPRFRGTSKMPDYEHVATKKPTNALGTLCMYESSEEEEEVESDRNSVEKQMSTTLKETEVVSEMKEVKEHCNSSDEAPDEAPVERVSNIPKPTPNIKNLTIKTFNTTHESIVKTLTVKSKFQRKTGLNYGKLHRRHQHTMLEKLLEADIRHERNVLLQCVRFVVDNKFFGIGGQKQSLTTENHT